MDEQKSYRPISEHDVEYHIKEPTGGTYKKLKMLFLKNITSGVAEKISIAKEFKLFKDFRDKKETEKFVLSIEKEALSSEEFYEKLIQILFVEEMDKKFKYDMINLQEVNRATNDFLELATGT